jgi:protein-disulfide isomerase
LTAPILLHAESLRGTSSVIDPAILPSRRHILMLTAGAAVVGVAAVWGLAWPSMAQRKKAAAAVEFSLEELMKQGPLADLALGKDDAPITVVEYASMTCGHCASFHNKVFPALKEKYVDTGKVRFIFREFPLDNLAAAASMLARCAGGEKTFPLISALFHTQETWAFTRGDPRPELLKVARQAGFTQETFDKCLSDQKLLDDIAAVRTRASETFGVNSTPTFFVNGKKLDAGPTLEEFDKVFAPILKS